jgi:hypothetical protein
MLDGSWSGKFWESDITCFRPCLAPFRKALLTAQRKEPQQANTSMERASGFVSCKEISLWEKNYYGHLHYLLLLRFSIKLQEERAWDKESYAGRHSSWAVCSQWFMECWLPRKSINNGISLIFRQDFLRKAVLTKRVLMAAKLQQRTEA